MLSVLTAMPFFAVCAFIWPSAKGAHSGIFIALSYLVALPLTWQFFRKR